MSTTFDKLDLGNRAGVARRLCEVNIGELSDAELKVICMDDEFHPGVHGVDAVRRCMKVCGHEFDIRDAYDLLRIEPIDEIKKIFNEVRFELPSTAMICFCPKDPAVLSWLRASYNVAPSGTLCQLAVLDGYDETLKYIINNSDNPAELIKKVNRFREMVGIHI